MINILYFAWIRQRIGRGSEELSPPDRVTNVGQLIEWLCEQGPGYVAAFEDLETVRMAVNQEHVEADHPVRSGDEVAFFPPVTGG